MPKKRPDTEPKPYGKFVGGIVMGTARYHGKDHQKVLMTGCPDHLIAREVSAKEIRKMMACAKTAEYISGEALHA